MLERLVKSSCFYLLRKLVQISYIFSDNVRISYIISSDNVRILYIYFLRQCTNIVYIYVCINGVSSNPIEGRTNI